MYNKLLLETTYIGNADEFAESLSLMGELLESEDLRTCPVRDLLPPQHSYHHPRQEGESTTTSSTGLLGGPCYTAQ